MSDARHRLDIHRSNGELWDRLHGWESELRDMAERMATVYGQRSWRFDLYEGGTLKATYKRGVWTEHGEERA